MEIDKSVRAAFTPAEVVEALRAHYASALRTMPEPGKVGLLGGSYGVTLTWDLPREKAAPAPAYRGPEPAPAPGP